MIKLLYANPPHDEWTPFLLRLKATTAINRSALSALRLIHTGVKNTKSTAGMIVAGDAEAPGCQSRQPGQPTYLLINVFDPLTAAIDTKAFADLKG